MFRSAAQAGVFAAPFAALALPATGCMQGREVKAPAAAPKPAASAPTMTKDGLLVLEPTNTPSAVFLLQGRPFCFSGTNNYYLTYKNKAMVDDVFVQAKAMGLEVLRTWAFIDRGALDDSVPSTDRNDWEPPGTKAGVYFQYWDTERQAVAYNEGAEKDDGLVRLDYLLAKAAEHNLKLVLVLTNNWKEFGGMDQYLEWFDLRYHHEFYTDPRARQAYKDYAAHLIDRVNTLTNVVYRNDPNIFAWELANEPRCRNFGRYDQAQGCGPETITAWVKEMSEHIKSLDPNHMVAVGDEGFFNRAGESSDQYSGQDGVDHEALLALPSIDYGTFHLYPDTWSTSIKWANQWIVDHLAAAQKAGKPTVLEEYGIVVKRDEETGKIIGGYDRRRTAYTNWNNLMLERGGNGSMFWMLAGIDPSNPSTGQYRDLDHFAVYNVPEDPSAQLLRDVAARFDTGARACRLANARGVAGAPSPFVSTQAASAAPAAVQPAPSPANPPEPSSDKS